jgi:transposase
MKAVYTKKPLFGAFDLHANNNYLAIIDEQDRRIYENRLANSPEVVLAELAPFQQDLTGIVVESTFNWYWLVDLLMDEGYQLHLANPAGIQKYTGLKHSSDRHDAFWLAHMLRLGILPEGHIYSKHERPIRDLLRKRSHLVRVRTSLINSLHDIIYRNCDYKINSNKIKALTEDHLSELFAGRHELALSVEVSKQSIDALTAAIRRIERSVLGAVKLKDEFIKLLTVPGIGNILALTIMLETGDISRFRKVGNFSSYCRKVPSIWTSNNKKKGSGNTKNGNKYLAWAFSEAAEFTRRYDERARAFYHRKMARTCRMVAHKAVAHKIARAAYYIMRDKVNYSSEKLFC